MPYLKILTNLDVPEKNDLLRHASVIISEALHKPEDWVMVSLESKLDMIFAGSFDPVAFIEVKSIELPENRTAELSEKICDFIESKLKIPGERIYIEFTNAKGNMWGWNSDTF